MRADKDPSEWPEVRDGRLTCDLVVGEAHQDLGAPCADAEVARSTAALLIRLTRRGFGIAPASRRAPKSDDLAETRSFSDNAGAAEDDLVVRTDPRIVGLRSVGSSVEREVDAGRHDCHGPTVTADRAGSCHPTGLRPRPDAGPYDGFDDRYERGRARPRASARYGAPTPPPLPCGAQRPRGVCRSG